MSKTIHERNLIEMRRRARARVEASLRRLRVFMYVLTCITFILTALAVVVAFREESQATRGEWLFISILMGSTGVLAGLMFVYRKTVEDTLTLRIRLKLGEDYLETEPGTPRTVIRAELDEKFDDGSNE